MNTDWTVTTWMSEEMYAQRARTMVGDRLWLLYCNAATAADMAANCAEREESIGASEKMTVCWMLLLNLKFRLVELNAERTVSPNKTTCTKVPNTKYLEDEELVLETGALLCLISHLKKGAVKARVKPTARGCRALCGWLTGGHTRMANWIREYENGPTAHGGIVSPSDEKAPSETTIVLDETEASQVQISGYKGSPSY